MTCPRCARDLLITAANAFATSDIGAVLQAMLESSTEIDDPQVARAIFGERERLRVMGVTPNFDYWISYLAVPPPLPASPPQPCGGCGPSARILQQTDPPQ